MIELGRMNELKVVYKNNTGYELSDEDGKSVFMPTHNTQQEHSVNDMVPVFIYKDSDNELCATTKKPPIQLNEFGYLKVNEVGQYGAFLDWGLDKDLFVPFSEQKRKMLDGRRYPVFLYLDEDTDRLVASSKLTKFFEKEAITVTEGEEVDLLVYEFTDLGMNVVINNLHKGLVYESEVFKTIRPGDRLKGYVKLIREDYKIDISLQKQGYQNVEPNAQLILDRLKENQGYLNLNDKSDPLDISYELEMSKKTFKKAIGSLYKQRLIRIEENGIYLV